MAERVEDFGSGTLTAGISDIDTTLSSTGFTTLQAIVGPDTLKIVLDPQGVDGSPEIVTITAHTAASSSVTVTRGANNRAHSADTRWVHAVTAADLIRMGFEGTYTGNVTGDVTGNADTATALATARTFDLDGDVTVTGQLFDGSSDLTLTVAVNNDSHSHTGSTLSAIPASDITAGTFGSGDYNFPSDIGVSSGIFYSGTVGTNDYLQISEGSNYARFVLDGGEEWRVTSSGDTYQAGDYMAFNSLSSVNDSIRISGDHTYFRTNGVNRAVMSSAGDLWQSGDFMIFNNSTISGAADYVRNDGTNFYFVTDGDEMVRIVRASATTGYLRVHGDTSTAETGITPLFGFSDDIDCGLYRNGTNNVAIAAGGTNAAVFTNSGAAFHRLTSTITAAEHVNQAGWQDVSVNGADFVAFRKWALSSTLDVKSDVQDWAVDRDLFMEFRPTSFIYNDWAVDPATGEAVTTQRGPGEDPFEFTDEMIPFRRYGFVYEETIEHGLEFVRSMTAGKGLNWEAISTMTLGQTQDQWIEIDAIKARLDAAGL